MEADNCIKASKLSFDKGLTQANDLLNRRVFTNCIKISTSYVIDENDDKTVSIFIIARKFINKIIRLVMKIINMKMAIGIGLLLLIADIMIAVFAK